MNLYKLGIRFSDNDYSATVRGFLELVGLNGLDNYSNLTRFDWVELFNRSTPGIYWAAQNRFKFRNDPGVVGDGSDPSDYLVRRSKKICFNKEVDDYISAHGGWDNGEFHYIEVADPKQPYAYVIESI